MNERPRPRLLEDFDALYLPHPTFTKALDEISAALDTEAAPFSGRPNLLVVGPAGIGKSTLIRKLRRAHPPVPNGRSSMLLNKTRIYVDNKPLLDLEMPSEPTVDKLGRRMLERLGDPAWEVGKNSIVLGRLQKLLSACGVRAVLIDEAQRAVDRDGVVRREAIAEWLKELHSLTGIVIVLLGVQRTEVLLEHDEQLGRRWDEALVMEPYAWGPESEDPESRNDFRGIVAEQLRQIEELRLMVDPALDVEKDLALKRFYYATRGIIGLSSKLLRKCLDISLKRVARDKLDELPPLTLELLHEAYESAFPRGASPGRANPFVADWLPCMPPTSDEDEILLGIARSKTRSKRRPGRRAAGTRKDRVLALRQGLSKR